MGMGVRKMGIRECVGGGGGGGGSGHWVILIKGVYIMA